MVLTAEDWPIAAAMLPFPARMPDDGDDAQLRSDWSRALQEVADAGFTNVDLTDSWVRYGDLDAGRRGNLQEVLAENNLVPSSLSAIRRSVIDARDADENLAYSHRSLEFAAELGIGVVSVGLHQALTPQQREQLWFWTVPGHRDLPMIARAGTSLSDGFVSLVRTPPSSGFCCRWRCTSTRTSAPPHPQCA